MEKILLFLDKPQTLEKFNKFLFNSFKKIAKAYIRMQIKQITNTDSYSNSFANNEYFR